MSAFAAIVEARILEAIENGEFDNLQGAGKPLDLEAYFAAPSALRAGFGFLKSAGVVPPEVEALRTVAHLRERLTRTTEGAARERLRQELQARETELAMAMERIKLALKADAVA